MIASPVLRIGTRGSPLALAQAVLVRDRLAAAHPDLADPAAIAIIVIRTTGDRVQDRPLAEIGGKGLFTKEIEEALLAGAIDLAVHSMKDVATRLPDGLAIPCVLPRADPRDAFLSRRAATLADLPPGAVIGTSSLRRQAQILNRRPDLRVAALRGNLATRMRKLADGECDATLLALAGLQRLGQSEVAASVLSVEEMLPAAAQGAIGVQCRRDDAAAARILPLDDPAAAACVAAERALLAALDGSCRTPIAALAVIVAGALFLRGLVSTPDGRHCHRLAAGGPPADAARLGGEAGAELRARAGPRFLAQF